MEKNRVVMIPSGFSKGRESMVFFTSIHRIIREYEMEFGIHPDTIICKGNRSDLIAGTIRSLMSNYNVSNADGDYDTITLKCSSKPTIKCIDNGGDIPMGNSFDGMVCNGIQRPQVWQVKDLNAVCIKLHRTL
jgi:hypothetical protein